MIPTMSNNIKKLKDKLNKTIWTDNVEKLISMARDFNTKDVL